MIRPSTLPKLALSPCYVSSPFAGDAAARGTVLDVALREKLLGNFAPFDALNAEDKKAVLWAEKEILKIAKGEHVETREDHLKVKTPGIEHVGTEDARVASRCLSFDLKTGQIRNYREQFAAYALGNMDAYFSDEWTNVAIFCDQMEAIHYTFTREEAANIVNSVMFSASDRKPDEFTPSEYCGWCANKDTCPTRTGPVEDSIRQVELVSASLEPAPIVSLDIAKMREGILSNPETTAKFITAFKLLEKEIAEPVIDAAKEMLKEKEDCIPGWKIQYQSGREFFGTEAILALYDKCSRETFVEIMGGTMSGKSYREACAQLNIEVDELLAKQGKQIEKLVAAKPTKKKTK